MNKFKLSLENDAMRHSRGHGKLTCGYSFMLYRVQETKSPVGFGGETPDRVWDEVPTYTAPTRRLEERRAKLADTVDRRTVIA